MAVRLRCAVFIFVTLVYILFGNALCEKHFTPGPGEDSELDDVTLSDVVSEMLVRQELVQRNSHVFVQLGRVLIENSTKAAKNNFADRGGIERLIDRAIIEDKIGKQNTQNNVLDATYKKAGRPTRKPKPPAKPKNIGYRPGYEAWPYIYLPQANSTLSNIMKPPGYIKREGRPVRLSEAEVGALRKSVREVGKQHRPQDSSQWETIQLYRQRDNLAPYQRWHNAISRHALYPRDEALLSDVMRSLANRRITRVEDTGDDGSQVKFVMHLEDGGKAMVKPIRFTREIEAWPNHYYFPDHERHTAEIAAFQLDRLLNFRRVPPVVGRLINMTSELFAVGDEKLKKECFISPAGNVCYRGNCDYYCDLHHLTCGRPEVIEMSVMAFLPEKEQLNRKSNLHPWKKSYSTRHRAIFEDENTCADVRAQPLYQEGRRFLDIMDTCVFDFLTGNTDRHHYNTFKKWMNHTAAIHFDNGKGFGCSHEDELINLLPIKQCCTIRFTTLRTLLEYHDSKVSLGQALKASLESDILAPVLLDPHFDAVDRRASLVLQTIANCLIDNKLNVTGIVVDDGF